MADLDLPQSQGEIYAALTKNDVVKVQHWLSSGWRVNRRVTCRHNHTRGHMTPLCLAVRVQSMELAQILILAGANPNISSWIEDEGGKTKLYPLGEAVRTSRVDLASLLIQAGADVNQKAQGTKTEDEEEGGTIIFGDAEQTYLHDSSLHGQAEMMEVLLEGGADVNAVNSHNKTPLLVACAGLHYDCILSLLRWGAPVNQSLEHNRKLLLAVAFPGMYNTWDDIVWRQRCLQLLWDAGGWLGREPWSVKLQEVWFPGITIEQLIPWIERVPNSVRSLKQICRIHVRRILILVNNCKPPVIHGMTGLPQDLRHYLCFAEYRNP